LVTTSVVSWANLILGTSPLALFSSSTTSSPIQGYSSTDFSWDMGIDYGESDNQKERGKISKLYYHGCEQCFDFSVIFVNKCGKIKTEEDFEKHKADFVKHFNEKHYDLWLKREGKSTKKPDESELFTMNDINWADIHVELNEVMQHEWETERLGYETTVRRLFGPSIFRPDGTMREL